MIETEPTDADLDALAAELALPTPERHPRPLGTAQPERTRIAALDGGSTNGVQESAIPRKVRGGAIVITTWDNTGRGRVDSFGAIAASPAIFARFKAEQEGQECAS